MSRLQSTTEERKHGRDVTLTAQMPGQIDVRVRHMCKRVTLLRPMFITKRKYSAETDEIIRREHPRLIIASSWAGKHADKLKPETRQARAFLLWLQLRPYVELYDTTESIAIAGHLAGKDFYSEEDNNRDQARVLLDRARTRAGHQPGRQPAGPRH